MEEIHDVLARLELHEGRAVVLPELGEGGTHVAQDGTVVGLGVESRGALAKHLSLREELLVHFEADAKADLLIVDGSFQPDVLRCGR